MASGLSALLAHQRAADTAGHNIANASTAGYRRQRLDLASRVPPAVPGTPQVGTGVLAVALERTTDVLADAAVRADAGGAGAALARADLLGRTEGLLGAYPDDLTTAVSRLAAAFDDLAVSPQSAATRTVALSSLEELASGVREAAQRLDAVEVAATSALGPLVDDVTTLASEVAALHRPIAEARALGQEPNELLDRRDTVLDRLGELTGARVTPRADGGVEVRVGASPLVQGPSTSPLRLSAGPPVAVLDVAGDPVRAGGRLGGTLAVLSADVPGLRGALDRSATDVRDALNAASAAQFDLSGAPGGPLLTGTDARSLAVAPGLTAATLAASASGAADDGNGALALGTAVREGRPGAPAVGAALSEVGATAGALLAGARRATAAALSTRDASVARREATTGVSLDEEMVDLVRSQQAYTAATRVISAVDEMVQTLLGMVR